MEIVLTVTALYFLALLAIGWWSYRASLPTPEDYFMASRRLGSSVLFLGTYATNMTAFFMIGIPGQAYHSGIGVFGWVASSFSFIVPITFMVIGYRCWLLGKKYGYMTQAQIFGERWQSSAVAITMFLLLTYYMVPYMVMGIIGSGLTFDSATRGAVPYWAGSLLVVLIILFYVVLGGMRGTAWINVFQRAVFLIFLAIAFFSIARALGGLEEITQRILAEKPELFRCTGVPEFAPKRWFSFSLIPSFAVIAFPHVFTRLLAAKSHVPLKHTCVLYPLVALISWIPVVMIGTWGAVAIPGLEGKESDRIMPMMIGSYLPIWMSGLGLAAIFAVIMSSLDAQILTLSIMFTRDILSRYTPGFLRGREVLIGRAFVLVVVLISYILALLQPRSIIGISEYAFTGFVLLIPVMIAGLYWRRSNKYGAMAAMLGGTLTLFLLPGGIVPVLPESLLFGFMPIVPCLIVTVFLLVAVTYLTPPAPEEATGKFFDLFDAALAKKADEKMALARQMRK